MKKKAALKAGRGASTHPSSIGLITGRPENTNSLGGKGSSRSWLQSFQNPVFSKFRDILLIAKVLHYTYLPFLTNQRETNNKYLYIQGAFNNS